METETETDRNEPNFRAASTVEAMNEAYCCSIEIFEGYFKVWSSGHLLPFYTSDTCTLELTQSGDLQLTGKNDRLGWRSGTSGQGVERSVETLGWCCCCCWNPFHGSNLYTFKNFLQKQLHRQKVHQIVHEAGDRDQIPCWLSSGNLCEPFYFFLNMLFIFEEMYL